MRRTILAVVVGALVVAATVRLCIVPVSVAAAKARAVVLPGSVSEVGYHAATNLATDAALALPGVVVAVLIARRLRFEPLSLREPPVFRRHPLRTGLHG